MSLLTIQQLFSGEFIPALCRTLAHSLWQGLLLAVLAGIVLVATRRSSSVLRYNLLTGIYLIFIAGIVITFYIQLNNLSGAAHLANGITLDQPEKNTQPTTFIHAQDQATISSTIIAFIDRYSNIIAFAWFLIFLFKAIRLATGLYDVHRIKRMEISDASEFWNERLRLLSGKLGIGRSVRLLQSGIATVPVVLGYFKPIILFPAALLASLPAAEVEAVLLHELAHVRRGDYLVNLLQQLVEVFFFFNPAITWVSSLIKVERENCCDDIALAQTSNNKINYINALIAFQEYRLALPQYAPALMGRQDHLLHRVKRIIYNNNKTLNAMEKIFLTTGIAVAALLALAFSSGKDNGGLKATVATQPVKSMTTKTTPVPLTRKDTIPLPLGKLSFEGLNNINTMVDGKRYDLQLNNGNVTALSIDGQKIPDDKIADYKTTTDGIIRQAQENILKEKLLSHKALLEAEHAKTDADVSRMLAEKMQKESEASKVDKENTLLLLHKLSELHVEQSKLKEEQTLKLLMELKEKIKTNDAKSLQHTELLLEKLKTEQSLSDSKLSKELAVKLHSLNVTDAKHHLLLAQMEKELSQKDLLSSRVDGETAWHLSEKLRASAELSMIKDKQLHLDAQANSEQIINDLISEKLIKSKKNLSFSLNKDALIVNGVKQPDGIFQKFKEKYVKTEDWNFNYNSKE